MGEKKEGDDRMSAAVERQVIVTWYTPDEKMPPEGDFVVVPFSGTDRNRTYDHAFGIANWWMTAKAGRLMDSMRKQCSRFMRGETCCRTDWR